MDLKVKICNIIFLLKDMLYLIVVGLDKIDPNEGCLFISRHTTHNAEIQSVIVCAYHETGRVIR
jgi:hypothetical protein